MRFKWTAAAVCPRVDAASHCRINIALTRITFDVHLRALRFRRSVDISPDRYPVREIIGEFYGMNSGKSILAR